jgi:hypothetical protein
MKDQAFINNYFNAEWPRLSTGMSQYKYSGLSLAQKIDPNEWVLDVGCGANPFKGLIPNLVGIDPANTAADIQVSLEDYETDQKFDVAFCLGSLNFGDVNDIAAQLTKLNTLLKPHARIYWRCNPGLQDHGTEGCKQIEFFPWSIDWHLKLAVQFGYVLVDFKWDAFNRIYAQWNRISPV